MSIANISYTMNRIMSATPESQIAVFKTEKQGMLDSLFASTVETRKRIKTDKDFIGTYDKTMGMQQVRIELENNA